MLAYLTTTLNLIIPRHPPLQRLESQTPAFPTSPVTCDRHTAQHWPVKHILKSAGVGEGGRDLGKLISCYSASQGLAFNFDVTAEAGEPLLQL